MAKTAVKPAPKAESTHKGGNIKTGKYTGVYGAKMQRRADELGMDYKVIGGKGKFVPRPGAAPAKPIPVKEPPAPKPRAYTDKDTAKEDFFEALNKTIVEEMEEPAAAEPPPAEPAAAPAKEDPKKEEKKEEPKAEEPPPGFNFEFEWDDKDVEVALNMIPLITIPVSSLIAFMFGRTLVVEQIEMSDFKKNLLRPGIKHYGYKIMKMICNPEFFWTALVGIMIFDGIFNSVKNPEPPKGRDHREEPEIHDIPYKDVA